MSAIPATENDSGIQAGQTQYVRYGNAFLMGVCQSRQCVVVFWSHWAQPVSADIWDQREFLREPSHARLLTGEERLQAAAYFRRHQGTALPLPSDLASDAPRRIRP